ncbi:MAG: hypothetical protein JNK76_10305 [Planctomycetales bacterium]|nr:hypothetical protein [Planctomycetales bacterium]MBN8623904.1 hypothetical protein [Planctomycetota bacterium]
MIAFKDARRNAPQLISLSAEQRPQEALHFGPYLPPQVAVGEVVDCAIRGQVTVAGVSRGRIPWPLAKSPGERRCSLVVFDDLEKAVHLESAAAVKYWWGATEKVVSAWRAAFGVRYNFGDYQLHSALSRANWPRIAEKLHAAAQLPERAAKIAESLRGKKRPKRVVEKVRRSNLGRKHTLKARANMSAAHRRRGTRPPWLNAAWSAEEDDVLRQHSAAEAMHILNRSRAAVACRRSRLGLSSKP